MLIVSFSKLALLLIFGQVEAEILGLKHTRGHFYFSHKYGGDYSVSAILITLLEFQKLNLTSCITFCDTVNTNDKDVKKKILKIDFFLKLLIENDLKLLENVKTANDPRCVLASISQLLLGQKSKVRSVLKSTCSQLFNNVLTVDFWPSRS